MKLGLILVFLLIPLIVVATITNPISYTEFEELLNGIADFLFKFGIALIPIAIIAGAYYFITAGGEAEKIETGKKIIIYAIIGVIVIFLAQAIINEILPVLQKYSG